MKHEKTKSRRLWELFRWAVLGVLVLGAGCFYSCESQEKAGEPVMLVTGDASEQKDAGLMPDTEQEKPSGDAENQTEAEGRSEAGKPSGVCYVYVCGQVQKPGVYMLLEGQRIYEAVEMAGGFTGEAAEGYLNLAALVTDGMMIQVPDQQQAETVLSEAGRMASSEAWTGQTGEKQSGKVNLNTATLEELMTLTGIGRSRAEDIIRYREKNGAFARIEDIMKVSGIKEASFEKIRDQITV